MASFSQIINGETPVLIDFHATWCGPCKAFMPTLQALKDELGDTVKVVKIDIDKNQALAQKLAIKSVPTIHLYQKGDLKWSTLGGQTKEALKHQIEKLGV